MRKILSILIILLILTSISTFAQSEKCDINKLLIIHENMDNLTFQMIEDFLFTFDESCENNVEYSEWSTELLFKVIDKWTNLYFKVLTSEKITNDNCILKTFSDPLLDYNFQKIYDKIKVVETVENIKSCYLNVLIEIAKNDGLEIER